MRGITLTISLPQPVRDQVEQVAAAEQVSIAEVVRRAIRAELVRVREFKPGILVGRDPAAQ